MAALAAWAGATLAAAQWTPAEQAGIADALKVGNMSPTDLNYIRRMVEPARPMAFVEEAIDNPLVISNTLMGMHREAVSGDLSERLLAAAQLHGVTEPLPLAPGGAPALGELPEPLRAPIGRLIAVMQAADLKVREATANLSAAEQRTLVDRLPGIATEEPKVVFSFVRPSTATDAEVWALLDKVDQRKLIGAAITVAQESERCRNALRATNADVAGKLKIKIGSYVVVVGGRGPTFHDDVDARLTIDLGGADTYMGRHGAGVGYTGVLIDLGGNDTYSPADLSVGAAILGIGLAYDNAGDDHYRGGSLQFGASLAGVGGLCDTAGNDVYHTEGLGQGFALAGAGVCLDQAGDDQYFVGLLGQGAGRTQGVGWLIDRTGADIYRAGSIALNEPLFTGVFYAFAQGFGMGYRDDRGGIAGGVGLLTDGAGNDVYSGDTYAQAASYWFGVGSLGDLEGGDLYSAHHYAQASAMHACFAFLYDAAGEDTYAVKVGAAHAIGHDYGVAVLVDQGGDDTYTSRDSTPGIGSANGLGVFVESAGNDRYHGPPGRGLAARGSGSVGVFVDLTGQDLYRFGLGDDQAAARETWGVARDVETRFSDETPPVTPENPPVPGSKLMPSDAEMANLYRRATQWGVGSAQEDTQAAVRELIAIGAPAFDWMVTNRLAAAQRLEIRAFVAVAAAIKPQASQTLAMVILNGTSVQKENVLRIAVDAGLTDIGALLSGLMDDPALQMAAVRAAGPLQARAAIPSLNRLVLTGTTEVIRAAMISLAQIGDADSFGTAQAFIGHPDLPTRKAAIALLAKNPVALLAAADRMAQEADVIRARAPLEALGLVGSQEALAVIAKFLLDPRPELRIEALRQLSGRVPEGSRATVVALQRDPVQLVREVARGTVLGQ